MHKMITVLQRQLTRPRARLCGFAIWALLAGCADPQPQVGTHGIGSVVAASDLAGDARLAANGKLPILLVVTRHDCPYCVRIKRDVLGPMLTSGDYENRVVIRELMIEPAYLVRDFAGREVISEELAVRYDATFTPTVLLLDASGNEIAGRLIGINTVELYGYYLDQAINEALDYLRP